MYDRKSGSDSGHFFKYGSRSGQILAGFYFNVLNDLNVLIIVFSAGKPFYAKLQINFTSELILKSKSTYIVL